MCQKSKHIIQTISPYPNLKCFQYFTYNWNINLPGVILEISEYSKMLSRNGEMSTKNFQFLNLSLLRNILRRLDSYSLWNVSLLNKFFRMICETLLDEKGVTYLRWERREGRWVPSEIVKQFSGVSAPIKNWKLNNFQQIHNFQKCRESIVQSQIDEQLNNTHYVDLEEILRRQRVFFIIIDFTSFRVIFLDFFIIYFSI